MKTDVPKLRTAVLVTGALLSVLVLVIFSLVATRAYRNETSGTVDNISQVYLQELTQQIGRHFETNMNNHFAQMNMLAQVMSEEDLADEETLRVFLSEAKEDYGLTEIMFISDKRTAYFSDETVYFISNIAGLDKLMQGDSRVISRSGNFCEEESILLGCTIDAIEFQGEKLVAAVVGVSIDTVSEKLVLSRGNGNSFEDIISASGEYIVKSDDGEDLYQGSNLFTVLKEQAKFDGDYTLDAIRQDFAEGRSGMASMTLNGEEHNYIYYEPIPETEWYIVTSMSYETVFSQVTRLGQFMIFVLVGIFLLILLIMISFFNFFYKREQQYSGILEEERDRAESASRAKSDFLSQMSHEIRTPLNGIIGMTEVGRGYVKNPDRMEACLDTITVSSRHLLALINDILDMAKIESGKVELHREPFALSQLIHSQTTVFYLQAKEKGIQYRVEMGEDLPEMLICDYLRLSQILNNLLSNALKFTPRGGDVFLRIEAWKQNGRQCRMHFSVTDTGCGIAPENMDKIFESFAQENSGITRQYGGTGLGLPISRQLLEMMGGEIHVESKVGEGSTFSVELPMEIAEAPVHDFSSIAGKRLLILNGSTHVLPGLINVAERAGLVTDVAETTDEAIAFNQEYDYCFIRWNFTRDIAGFWKRYERAGIKLPKRIIVTGYDKNESADVADLIGVKDVLNCPIFADDLEALLCEETGKTAGENTGELQQESILKGKHVLVVEDNEINQKIAMELLKSVGAVVNSAANGRDAVKLFSISGESYYDLVLMDIQMPIMDGYSATQAIRALPRRDVNRVVILAMTANTFQEDVDKSLESGMNGHVGKPFFMKTIEDTYLACVKHTKEQ